MLFHILSDLHKEQEDFVPPNTKANTVLLAGDIANGVHGVLWAAKAFPHKQVIYVPGCHEFSGWRHDTLRKALQLEAADTHNVRVLDNQSFTLWVPDEPTVRVIGTTLWSDFALLGFDKVGQCGMAYEHSSTDLRDIRTQGGNRMHWEDCIPMFQANVRWLERELEKAQSLRQKVVVVSHHAPSAKSIPAHFTNDPAAAGFASDLEYLMDGIDLWVHGYTHQAVDYQVGRCRVMANPRGFAFRKGLDGRPENAKFKSNLTVAV